MKAYMSFPISGHDIDLVSKIAGEAKKLLEEKLPGWEIINPLELCSDIEQDDSKSPRTKYAEEMGRDISMLLQCDAFIFIDGIGAPSAGCKIEQAVVTEWNKAHPEAYIEEHLLLYGDLLIKSHIQL